MKGGFDPLEQQGRYACPVTTCAARFSSIGEKKQHLRLDHERKDLPCPVCKGRRSHAAACSVPVLGVQR